MIWKIWKAGSYLYMKNTVDGQYIAGLASKFEFKKPNDLGTVYGLHKDSNIEPLFTFDESMVLDENNVSFSAQTFRTFKDLLTGINMTGVKPYKLISLGTTNSTVVKSVGGSLHSVIAIGLTSTVRYLKFYNKATAPIVGTDIPVMTIPIPANTQGAGIVIPFSTGVDFQLGIGIAITSESSDSDTAAVVAGDVIINLTYA
jgi:hypothetical protein